MAICCGKIDKTMQAGKLKSLGYFILFMGLLGVSAVAMSLWSIFRKEIKIVPKILFSLCLVFISESRRLSIIPAEKKSRLAGKIYRFSPPLSGYFYKYFDIFLILSILCIMTAGIYGLIKLFLGIYLHRQTN